MLDLNDMDCILPKLYLGNELASQDIAMLSEFSITHILQIKDTRQQQTQQTSSECNNIQYMTIYLDDNSDEDILSHIPKCVEFISQIMESGKGSILVHCTMGISRSASIVCAFLMRHLNISADHALNMIRKVRPMVQPNQGFLKALQEYEQLLLRNN
ncbi:hypothetical protein C9374_013965 [Naegleria lovaniensis]|uniref:protein-tyrosine-phosphatase n=1 Tax=Naegleria lovaniensis TaxID=51637 RepID=A0AA88GUY3_NAELO|nr:uncharacterized protein C9374_013965 [Naegleria lovaniensis]KAG2389405.1 hypothetical protein C9374_013965 [Naegleria lovaniensis]